MRRFEDGLSSGLAELGEGIVGIGIGRQVGSEDSEGR